MLSSYQVYQTFGQTKIILGLHNVVYFNTYLRSTPEFKHGSFKIVLDHFVINALKVFDSRPPVFKKPERNQGHLVQSFFGWNVVANEKVFNSSTIVMMDFNVPQTGQRNLSISFLFLKILHW